MDLSTLLLINFLCAMMSVMLIRQWHELPIMEFDNREIIVVWFCICPPFGVFALLTAMAYGLCRRVKKLFGRT